MSMQLDIKTAIEHYRDTVFRVAFTYLRNVADADDVAQDVFVKLLRTARDVTPDQGRTTKATAFSNEEHLRRWLIRVTINECKSLFRRPWRRTEDIENYTGTLAMPTQEHSDLFVSVMKLPERYRVPLVLYYYLGFTTNEIASLIKVPGATVRTRLARGRAQLKAILEKEESHAEQPAAEARL